MKAIHNLETGQIEIRDFNDDELAQLEIDKARAEAAAAEAAAKETARLAAEQKLAAIGLTKEDLTALGL